MPDNPPGLTLNSSPFPPNSVPFPGGLATDELREAYRQHKLELANRPPLPPLVPIEPGLNVLEALKNLCLAGLAARRRYRAERKMTGVVADDAILFGKHRDAGLSAKKARLEVIKDLIALGVAPKTAENRATAARYYWEDNLVTK
jgi:hypothetical protein